ncbi:MAG: hypothetical protein MHM6MM_001344 [Cercozoa sp. M6MM]
MQRLALRRVAHQAVRMASTTRVTALQEQAALRSQIWKYGFRFALFAGITGFPAYCLATDSGRELALSWCVASQKDLVKMSLMDMLSARAFAQQGLPMIMQAEFAVHGPRRVRTLLQKFDDRSVSPRERRTALVELLQLSASPLVLRELARNTDAIDIIIHDGLDKKQPVQVRMLALSTLKEMMNMVKGYPSHRREIAERIVDVQGLETLLLYAAMKQKAVGDLDPEARNFALSTATDVVTHLLMALPDKLGADNIDQQYVQSVCEVCANAAQNYLLGLKRADLALVALEQAVGYAKRAKSSHFVVLLQSMQGEALKTLGRRKESIEVMQEAVHTSPRAASRCFLPLAEMLMAEREYTRAVDVLLEAREHNAPTQSQDAVEKRRLESEYYGRISALLVSAYRRSGNIDKAVAEARRFAQLRPQNLRARTDLAELLINAGRWQEADAEVKQAMRLSRGIDSRTLLLHAKVAFAHHKDLEEAAFTLKGLLERRSDPDVLKLALRVFHKQGNANAVIKYGKLYVDDLGIDDLGCMLIYASALRQQKQPQDADRVLSRLVAELDARVGTQGRDFFNEPRNEPLRSVVLGAARAVFNLKQVRNAGELDIERVSEDMRPTAELLQMLVSFAC